MKKISISKLAFLVKNKRTELNMTQDDVGKKTGINRALVGRIERNEFLPSIIQLNALAEVLEFDLEELLEDDAPMVATAFRGSDLTVEEESALEHLFDMMTAVKQQVLLRKALHNENERASH